MWNSAQGPGLAAGELLALGELLAPGPQPGPAGPAEPATAVLGAGELTAAALGAGKPQNVLGDGATEAEGDGATEAEGEGDGAIVGTSVGAVVGRSPTGSGPTKTNAARTPAATITPARRPARIEIPVFIAGQGTSTDGRGRVCGAAARLGLL